MQQNDWLPAVLDKFFKLGTFQQQSVSLKSNWNGGGEKEEGEGGERMTEKVNSAAEQAQTDRQPGRQPGFIDDAQQPGGIPPLFSKHKIFLNTFLLPALFYFYFSLFFFFFVQIFWRHQNSEERGRRKRNLPKFAMSLRVLWRSLVTRVSADVRTHSWLFFIECVGNLSRRI